uniref:Ubiquitin thioesterase OTU n=1 Tax=Spongospora subterranea TaxID=70186 RepID=A0A0H5R6H1_9EUKA|eukprot:CRZ09431.1 hypothetical protein [Spongospora subterranea]
MLRLQVRGPSSRSVISSLSGQSSIHELSVAIEHAIGVPANEQRLLIGFPPKQLDISNGLLTLEQAGIKSGDSLIVEKISAVRGITKASAEETQSIIFTISKNQGLFVQRHMPPDNSCLFHSIAYVCMNRTRDAAAAMRKLISDTVASDSRTYNEALLDQPNRAYQSWIMNPNVWGGAIELYIFARSFQTEIVAFDPDYLREDVFGQECGFQKRVFLLYTAGNGQGQGGHSAHYDALVFSQSGASSESNDKVIFNVSDAYAWERARQFIESLHKNRVAKNSSLTLCKQWRRTQTGEATKASVGQSLLSGGTPLPSDVWNCSRCTFDNKRSDTVCTMCGAPNSR